jgi:type II secretory pathway pseudopilin PulG
VKVVRSKGFTYLGLLFAITLAGVGLALAGVVWHTAGKRAKEQQLLFAGSAIRSAIVNYYRRSPNGNFEFPRTLQDLIEDRRYVTMERHLRKIYIDPTTSNGEWGLIKSADGRIVGVHSQSREAPMKRDNFSDTTASFAQAQHYSDWRFSAADVQVTPSGNAVGSSAYSSDAFRPPPGAGR